MNFISSIVIGVALTVGGWFGIHQTQSVLPQSPIADASPTFGAFNPTGGGTYRLQSSVGLSNTTITLSAFKEPISNIPYTMSYLGSSIGYGTLDPQSTRSEFISFTGITQNSNGTAQLTGVTRGLTRTPAGNLCTASTTLTQAHSGQSIFILSDSPCLFAEYYVLRNNATSSGILVFGSTTPPRYDAVAAQSTGTYISTTSEFASIAYVNAIAVGGSSNATESVKGISELATALEQASSTILGTTGAGLVTQARYATDTPQSGCSVGYTAIAGAGCSVVASLSGKLKQAWIDLTQTFTWSGLHTFTAGLLGTASSTFSATTSIQASNVLSNAVKFNGVPYAFPSTQCASGKTWINDGSGNLSCGYSGKYSYYNASGVTVTAVSATSYGTSTSFTIPSGVLGASSTIQLIGNFSVNGGTAGTGKTITVSLRTPAGAIVATFMSESDSGSLYSGPFTTTFMNQSSVSSQAMITQCVLLGSGGAVAEINCSGNGTTAIDFTNAVSLVVVVQATNNGGAANAAGTVAPFAVIVNP